MGLDHPRYRVPTRSGRHVLTVAAVRFPHLSNFGDLDPLFADPRLHAAWCERPPDFPADIVVLPGTKNTLADLEWLDAQGWAAYIRERHASGAAVCGVCGGCQILGRRVSDPDRLESSHGERAGLGRSAHTTVLLGQKTVRRVSGTAAEPLPPHHVEGYELHLGTTRHSGRRPPLLLLEDGPDGFIEDGARLLGTYVHGLFDNDEFRESYLSRIADARGRAWPRASLPSP
ncbi:MAG: hypothetical protein ACP5QO_04440 [Clostridia bacterium]